MEWVACRDCDLLLDAIALRRGEEAHCVRCGAMLLLPRPMHDAQAGLAVLATAALSYAVALASPLMSLSELGRDTSASLPRSAVGMWMAGSPAAAVLVALFTIAFPGVHLALALTAGVGAVRDPVPRWAGRAARLTRIVTPWAMPEIMLLATLVAYVKVSEIAHASPGLGMYATATLAVLLALARNALDLPTIWSRIDWRGPRP